MRFRPRLESLEDRQMLSAGALDPTFGSGGIAQPSSSIWGGTGAVAVYSSAQGAAAGDVIAAGSVNTGNNNPVAHFGLVRYTPNGTPDSTFGNHGEVVTSFARPYAIASAAAVAIQPDGKVVAAGCAAGATSSGPSYDFALARYNLNGSLDSTFGSGGKVTTNLSGGSTQATGSNDTADAMFLQPDGKIVVAGATVTSSNSTSGFGLVRYNANGSLDATFGAGGKVLTSHNAIPGALQSNNVVYTHVTDAALQADGKILVGGSTQMAPSSPVTFAGFVARYNSNGTLDTSFGNGGFAVLPAGLGATLSVGHLAVEPGGEILVTSINRLMLLHSDGSFDTNFANPAIVSQGNGSVALEPNGDIVVGGGSSFLVSRFLPNGTPDATFGSDGVVTLPSSSYAHGLTIQPDGKIDLVSNGFLVDRLLPADPEIGSLTAGVNGNGTLTLTASNLTDSNPNGAITQVAFYAASGGTTTLLGYGAQTSPGVWTLTVSLSPGTYTLSAVAEDNYGVFGEALGISETLS